MERCTLVYMDTQGNAYAQWHPTRLTAKDEAKRLAQMPHIYAVAVIVDDSTIYQRTITSRSTKATRQARKAA